VPCTDRNRRLDSYRKRYHDRHHSGICSECDGPVKAGRSRCINHLKLSALKTKKHTDSLKRRGLCISCGIRPLVNKNHCDECRKISNEHKYRYRDKIINKVLDHYGRICSCCGETNILFLTMDHLDGNGQNHRINSDIYRTLYTEFQKTGNWNTRISVVCYNCNCGKWRNGGICPHKNITNWSRNERTSINN